jgi:hypothetical protein
VKRDDFSRFSLFVHSPSRVSDRFVPEGRLKTFLRESVASESESVSGAFAFVYASAHPSRPSRPSRPSPSSRKKRAFFPENREKKSRRKQKPPRLSVWSFASPPTSSSLGCFLVTSTPSKRSRKSNMYFKVDRHCDATRVSLETARAAKDASLPEKRAERAGPPSRVRHDKS